MKRRDRLTLLQLDGLRASLPSLSLRRTAAPPHRKAVVPLTKTLANSAIGEEFVERYRFVNLRGLRATQPHGGFERHPEHPGPGAGSGVAGYQVQASTLVARGCNGAAQHAHDQLVAAGGCGHAVADEGSER